MLEVIRDENENISAVLEWYLVSGLGNFDPQGKFVWIEEMEVSKDKRENTFKYVQEFIKIITNRAPQAQFGYFNRNKYQGRIRLYSKKRWEKLLGGRNEQISQKISL